MSRPLTSDDLGVEGLTGKINDFVTGRLLSKTVVCDECWIWHGAKTNGIPCIDTAPRNTGHRVSTTGLRLLTALKLDIPLRDLPAQTTLCGRRDCIRPSHAQVLPAGHNRAKDQPVTSDGDRRWVPKLCRDEIMAVKARAASGEKQSDIARSFGVHQSTVSRILRNAT